MLPYQNVSKSFSVATIIGNMYIMKFFSLLDQSKTLLIINEALTNYGAS